MSNQQPLEALRADLIWRGLPRRYVRRVVEELADHQQDLEQANAVGARLGDLGELADRLVAEFRSSRFVGRHPILAFVIAPIPLTVLTWMLVFVAMALLSMPLEGIGWATGCHVGACAIYYGLRFVPFAVAALVLCRSAYRSARGAWALAGCGLVALLAAALVADLRLPTDTEQGRMMFGVMFYGPGIDANLVEAVGRQVAQLAAPLAIWACFAVKFERRRRLAMVA